MPKYDIQAPDGRSFELEGDSPPTEQELEQVFASLPQGESTRQLKPSTVATIAEREAFGQQLQKEAGAPVLDKLIAQGAPIANVIKDLVMSNVRGIGGLPEMLSKPSTILPTALEGTRRAATDLGSFIVDAVKNNAMTPLLQPGSIRKVIGSQSPQDLLTNVLGTVPIIGSLQSLAPKTLTPEEIQRAFEESKAQQGAQDVRNQVDPRFSGAQPQVAEAVAKDLPLLLPAKGIKGSLGGTLESDIGRSIRAAVKPPNAQIGARIEKAGQAEMGDIFNVNPNADKSAVTPLEGFHESVSELRSQIGQQIGALRKRVGQTFTAGDDIAASLNKKADALERAGQPPEAVQLLRDRAENLKGKATDLEDLQLAVTTANQELTPFYSRSAMAQNPMLASAQTTANKVIAEEGGAAINKALESIGGPDAALLRKKWSNLTAIENQTAERLNKLINSAAPEIQNAAFGALNSLHGVAGLIGLLRGYAEGAIPLLTAGAKAFSKKARAELKDSHTIISKLYDELRKNPPASTLGQAAIMPLNVGGVRPQPSPMVPSEPTLQEFIQNSLRQQPQASF